jgi:hypothetical protein
MVKPTYLYHQLISGDILTRHKFLLDKLIMVISATIWLYKGVRGITAPQIAPCSASSMVISSPTNRIRIFITPEGVKPAREENPWVPA